MNAGLRTRLEDIRRRTRGGLAPELHPTADAVAQIVETDGTGAGRRRTSPAAPGPRAADHGRANGQGDRHRTADPPPGPVWNSEWGTRGPAPGLRSGDRRSPVVVLVTATRFDEALRLEENLDRGADVGPPGSRSPLWGSAGWLLTGGDVQARPADDRSRPTTISASGARGRLRDPTGGAELRELATRLNSMLDRIEEPRPGSEPSSTTPATSCGPRSRSFAGSSNSPVGGPEGTPRSSAPSIRCSTRSNTSNG